MGVLDVLRGITGGVAQASGNTAAANGIAGQQERARQAKANDLKMQLAPLTQAAQATQTRLALFADPNDPSKPVAGKEAEYAAAHDQLADIIGKQRMLLRPPPAEDPHGLSYLGARVADKLHITRDLANHMREAQSGKVDKYYQQGSKDVATAVQGIQPYQNTPEGQAGAEKAAQAQALETQRAKSASDVEAQRAASALAVEQERNKGKAPKGLKFDTATGQVKDLDTGKRYSKGDKDAPSEVSKMFESEGVIEKAKQDEIAKRDKDRADRLAATLGNMGTWTMAEDGNGATVLYNSKTGKTEEAPSGLHKSGYFAKQIAPLTAANLNIDEYLKNGVFDGAGDLALQHEFFTATQPATGFRMTKVQQDTLNNSRSWLESAEAKALHAKTGQWYTPEQRKQIAKAAQDAIANKIKALDDSAPVGNGTKQLLDLKGKGGKLTVKDLEDALAGK